MANVRFVRTTQAKQDNRLDYDINALYFCTDSGALYRGNQLLTDGVRSVETYSKLPKFSVAADGVIYYTLDTKNGYLMNSEKTEWLQIIYAPVTDISSVHEENISKVTATVGAVLDIKKELKDYIDKKTSTVSGIIDGGDI